MRASTSRSISITASYNSSTETLTLTGADTPAHYQSVLDSVTFSSTSDNPTNFGANLSRVLTWTVNDGGASNNQSAPQFTTVVITAVNDAPTLSSVAASAALSTPGSTITLSPNLSVSDPDNTTLASATVSVTSGTFAGDGDALATNVTGTSITASYNAATERLTLTGVDTLAHYRQVLDSVTFSSGANPTNSGANPTRTVTWVVNDGSAASTAQTTTISFQPALRLIGSGDTNGDFKADLVWDKNGTAVEWVNNNGTAFSQVAVPNAQIGAEWTPVGLGHDAAGHQEIVWTSNGNINLWQLNGTNLGAAMVLPGHVGAEWKVAATGDFDGNGSTDVLWQDANGRINVWSLNGLTLTGAAVGNMQMGAGWRVVATGDFYGTGRDAILWENASGNLVSWSLNGANVVASTVGQVGAEWRFAGTGNFTGSMQPNQRPDIVLVNTNNDVQIWHMSNGQIGQFITPSSHDGTEWHLTAVNDFTGDGKSDLLWLTDAGGGQLWQINGTQVAASFVTVPTGSTLVLNSSAAGQSGSSQGTSSGGALQASMADAPAADPQGTSPTMWQASDPAMSADLRDTALGTTLGFSQGGAGFPYGTPASLGFAQNGDAAAGMPPAGDSYAATLALLINHMAASFPTSGDGNGGVPASEALPQAALAAYLAPPQQPHA